MKRKAMKRRKENSLTESSQNSPIECDSDDSSDEEEPVAVVQPPELSQIESLPAELIVHLFKCLNNREDRKNLSFASKRLMGVYVNNQVTKKKEPLALTYKENVNLLQFGNVSVFIIGAHHLGQIQNLPSVQKMWPLYDEPKFIRFLRATYCAKKPIRLLIFGEPFQTLFSKVLTVLHKEYTWEQLMFDECTINRAMLLHFVNRKCSKLILKECKMNLTDIDCRMFFDSLTSNELCYERIEFMNEESEKYLKKRGQSLDEKRAAALKAHQAERALLEAQFQLPARARGRPRMNPPLPQLPPLPGNNVAGNIAGPSWRIFQ